MRRTSPTPLIVTRVQLNASSVVLSPSLDEVEELMHQLINSVLNVFHGVRKWGEVRAIRAENIHSYPMHDFAELLPTTRRTSIAAKTYYNTIANNKDLLKLYQNIGHFFPENRQR